ncbi:MAG: LexA family transcriptional regulator [Prevotella sp.]|jgi:bacteriophage CI repressor helix-turn-helix domain|uniref:Helix-turn-helix domain-containing protein n=1 Tax=Prevotella melaninogenica TaxID=28132 RepID=A0ABS6Y9S9_9BACT|nr:MULTISPECIES: LexA family transcriptional regulator [Prevotella]MBF1618877.1 LexA family transcriptional regulator [Prevotella sp.]MBW4755405.1 helix-turn-helix domain-containing protein [Prevotella melaninogenica]
MTKKERLEALIAHYSDGKPTRFAKHIGVAPSTISTWIARDTFDYDLLFAKCEKISPEWLLTGNGSMLKTALQEAMAVEPVRSESPNKGAPYYDVDFLGGFDLTFNDQTINPEYNIDFKPFNKQGVSWVNITGHSMEPRINHGDIIAIKECRLEDVQYGEIYAVVLDTIRTVKILRKSNNPDRMRYVPINEDNYDEQEYDNSRILRIFEVLGNVSRFI